MHKWAEKKLGELLTLQRGFDLPVNDRLPGPYPVVASTGIVGTHSQAMVEAPGVVIGRSGSLGGGQYIEQDFWPLNTTLWVKDFKGNDRLFCYYLLKSLDLARFNAGSGVPTLNRNHIHPLVVRVPLDVDEQREIAHILGTLDDKIELNRRMNATLEAIARAIFKSWFVDFDPVHAKARGEQPYGMDADTAALFPDAFEDSELGPIPAGWGVKPIGDTVTVVGGSTPRTKVAEYWEGGTISWATPKDLASLSSPVLLETSRQITEKGLAKISSGLLPKGTVLLSSRAPVGYLAIAEIPVAVNQGFIAMVCDQEMPSQYVYNWAKANMDLIESQANGTTFLEISKRNFRPIQLLIPPKDILCKFSRLTEPIYRRIVCNEKEIRTLAALRDALLPKLISGEICVNALEEISGG